MFRIKLYLNNSQNSKNQGRADGSKYFGTKLKIKKNWTYKKQNPIKIKYTSMKKIQVYIALKTLNVLSWE